MARCDALCYLVSTARAALVSAARAARGASTSFPLDPRIIEILTELRALLSELRARFPSLYSSAGATLARMRTPEGVAQVVGEWPEYIERMMRDPDGARSAEVWEFLAGVQRWAVAQTSRAEGSADPILEHVGRLARLGVELASEQAESLRQLDGLIESAVQPWFEHLGRAYAEAVMDSMEHPRRRRRTPVPPSEGAK